MASPEALLLRHRVHTTNICKKVSRSPRRRLFKIGHLFVYFLLFPTMPTPPLPPKGKAIQPVPKRDSYRAFCQPPQHGNFGDVWLAGYSKGSYTGARPLKRREGSPLFPTFVGLQFKLRKPLCWCPVATNPAAVRIARRALHGARSCPGRNECVSKRGSAF